MSGDDNKIVAFPDKNARERNGLKNTLRTFAVQAGLPMETFDQVLERMEPFISDVDSMPPFVSVSRFCPICAPRAQELVNENAAYFRDIIGRLLVKITELEMLKCL